MPRFESCWSMLVINSLRAIWAWWGLLYMDPTWVQARMPGYSLNRTKDSSAIQCSQWHPHLRRWPSRNQESFGLESFLDLDHRSEPKPCWRVDICIYLPPDRTWHKVNDPKVDYSGGWGKRRSGTNPGSSPAGLCWSSAHLMKWEPDELCWTWTQIWVRVRMPDYSLNLTRKSSAIQNC